MLTGACIHPDLMRVLSLCGHGDKVLIADGNYPLASRSGGAEKVYLGLTPGLPTVTDVLAAHGVNICNFRLARQKKGGEAVMTIEMDGSFDGALNREVEALPNILSSTMLQPI